VLLATATGLLALVTRAEVQASGQELALSRAAFEASTRPILLDAPLDVFTVEKEAAVFFPTPVEQGVPRRIHDLGEILVDAGYFSGEHDTVGYAHITVPFYNAGAGLALIGDAQADLQEWQISWRRSGQTGVAPGQIARVTFDADLDPGDGHVLQMELDGKQPVKFSVEVDYSDLNGEQRTRTRLTIQGTRSHWRVVEVSLYHDGVDEPFFVQDRERRAVAL